MVEYQTKKTKLKAPLTAEERLAHLESAKIPYDFRRLGPVPAEPIRKAHPNQIAGARKAAQTPGAKAGIRKNPVLIRNQRKCEVCNNIAVRGCKGCRYHGDGRKEWLRRQWSKGIVVENTSQAKYSALLNLIRSGNAPPGLVTSDAFQRVMAFIAKCKKVPDEERDRHYYKSYQAALALSYTLGLAWTHMEIDPSNRALWDQSLREMAEWGM